MRRPAIGRGLLAVITAVLVALAPAAAVAQETVSVDALLADPGDYEGKTIVLQGELIGDYGFRSDGSMWAQLNDDSYAYEPVVDGGPLTGPNQGVGVRMPEQIGRTLDPPGGYRVRGPIVRATGIWRYHDPARGGASYLEVSSVETVEPGEALNEGANWAALIAGLALLVASVALWFSYVAARDRH